MGASRSSLTGSTESALMHRDPRTGKITCNLNMMILGDVGVGKTSVFTSFIGHNPNELNEEGDPATDVMSHFVQSQPKRFKSEEGVELSVVGTIGHGPNVPGRYYRLKHVIVIIFDLCDRMSFEHAKTWRQEAERFGPVSSYHALIGNKLDAAEKMRRVPKEEAQAYADSVKMPYWECTAMVRTTVDEAFFAIMRQAVDTIKAAAK